MNFLKRAIKYCVRQRLRTLLLFLTFTSAVYNRFDCSFQRGSCFARNKADKGNCRCFRSYGN